MRIVSLLPAATEIACALGLRERLVGVSHECDFPPEARRLPKVTRSLIPSGAASAEIDALVRERMADGGALYSLDMPLLAQLRPDLILTQALCDVCAVAEEEVRQAACTLPGNPRVVNLEASRLSDVLASVRQVAEAAGVPERGTEVVKALEQRIGAVSERTACLNARPRVVVLEWIDPPFSAGHWTPELVELAGGIEVVGRAGLPSQTTAWETIIAGQPEVMLIACCGFDLERTRQDLPILKSRPGWSDLPCVRQGRVFMVDGSAYFSRPGPRLVDSLEILANAVHPAVHPLPPGLPPAQPIA